MNEVVEKSKEGQATKVTNGEKGLIAIMRFNRVYPRIEVIKSLRIGRFEVRYNWRSKKNLWGRFGGGWNWQLGIQIARTCIILNCLIFMLRFYWRRPKEEAKDE